MTDGITKVVLILYLLLFIVAAFLFGSQINEDEYLEFAITKVRHENVLSEARILRAIDAVVTFRNEPKGVEAEIGAVIRQLWIGTAMPDTTTMIDLRKLFDGDYDDTYKIRTLEVELAEAKRIADSLLKQAAEQPDSVEVPKEK